MERLIGRIEGKEKQNRTEEGHLNRGKSDAIPTNNL